MKLKKSVSVMLVAVMLGFAIAGCSGGSGGGNETQPASSSGAEQPEGQVTLRLSTWQLDQEGYSEFWNQAIEAFNKEHPNVKVEPYNYASTDYSSRLLVDLTAGTPPDLITLAGFDFAQLAAMDALEPLDGLLQNVNWDNFKKNLVDFAKVDGKLLAYPTMARTLQLMYNKPLLEAAGITEPPTTPEQFYEAVKKLQKSDGQYGFAFETNDNRYLYEDVQIWVHGFGGQLAKDGKPTLTDPKTIEAIQYLVKMVKEGIVPKGIGKSDIRLGFAQGKIAMLLDGAWVIPLVEKQNSDMLKDVVVTSTPFASKVTTGGTMNLIGVSSQSKHKAEAASFIEMISEPEWQKLWFENTATLTAGTDAIGEEELTDKPYVSEFVQGLDNAVPVPPQGLETQYNQFSGIVQKAVTQAFYSNESVESIMQAAQTEAEKLTSK